MDIQVSFKNMHAKENVSEYVSDKSETLKSYFGGKIKIHWTFSVQKTKCIAHCHLVGNHMDFFAEAKEGGFPAAVDRTLDKIEKQIRKKKEKVKDHHIQAKTKLKVESRKARSTKDID